MYKIGKKSPRHTYTYVFLYLIKDRCRSIIEMNSSFNICSFSLRSWKFSISLFVPSNLLYVTVIIFYRYIICNIVILSNLIRQIKRKTNVGKSYDKKYKDFILRNRQKIHLTSQTTQRCCYPSGFLRTIQLNKVSISSVSSLMSYFTRIIALLGVREV